MGVLAGLPKKSTESGDWYELFTKAVGIENNMPIIGTWRNVVSEEQADNDGAIIKTVH